MGYNGCNNVAKTPKIRAMAAIAVTGKIPQAHCCHKGI
jgi:hypothetical protein